MDTKHSTSNLPWIWVIETLATSNEIDTSLLIDLVKRTPEISEEMGRNIRELVSLKVLETLSVQEISNANIDASVLGEKIELDQSVHCEDVLRHLLLGVSSDQKMAGPDVSKWDVQSFITKKRSCLPKCALQQIKDTLDSTSLKAKNGLEVSSHSRDGDHFDAVNSNGIKQSREVRGSDAQHEHVLSSGNATPCLGANTNGMQENQPRTVVPSKRRIDAFTAHEGEHSETEPLSENSSGTCITPSKRFKQEVISPRRDEVHDFESSQRDDVSTELYAQIPHAIVSSQCTQGQDPLTIENGRVFNLCVKCNEGGQLLICSSNSCPFVVHQSCLGSVPSFDNGGNFYCPFCAYSRAISEYLEVKKMFSLARKDLASFVGIGARRQLKKSSRNSRRTKKNQSREDEELCHDKNNKDVLNEVIEARSAPVSRNSLDGEITEMPSPQPEASAPPELVSRQSGFEEESSEDEDAIASRYCVRFRNSDKN